MISKKHFNLVGSAVIGALMLFSFQNCGTKVSSDQNLKASLNSSTDINNLSIAADSEIVYRKSSGGYMPPRPDSEVLVSYTLDKGGRLYANYRDNSRKLIVEIGAWLPNHYLNQLKRVHNSQLYEYKKNENSAALADYYFIVEVLVNGQLKKIRGIETYEYELVPNGVGLAQGDLDYKAVVDLFDAQVTAILNAQNYK